MKKLRNCRVMNKLTGKYYYSWTDDSTIPDILDDTGVHILDKYAHLFTSELRSDFKDTNGMYIYEGNVLWTSLGDVVVYISRKGKWKVRFNENNTMKLKTAITNDNLIRILYERAVD